MCIVSSTKSWQGRKLIINARACMCMIRMQIYENILKKTKLYMVFSIQNDYLLTYLAVGCFDR